MTAQSEDQDQVNDYVDPVTEGEDSVEPAAKPAHRNSILVPTALDDLTEAGKSEPAAGTAHAVVAFTASANERLGETAKRMSDIVARYELTKPNGIVASAIPGVQSAGALRSFLEANALTRSTAMSSVIEALGRSSVDRAAFGESRRAHLGHNPKSPLAAFNKDVVHKIGIAGFETAINKSAFSNLGGIRSVLDTFEGAELALTRSLVTRQLVATSGVAGLIGSDKRVASWRQSLLSEATARSLIGTIAVPENGASLLRDIVGVNAATTRVVGRYAELNKARILAPAVSARPTRELRSYLAGMPVAPDLRGLRYRVRIT